MERKGDINLRLPSILRKIQRCFGILIPLIGLLFIFEFLLHYLRLSFLPQQYLGFIFAFSFAYFFLGKPSTINEKYIFPSWWSIFLATVSLIAGIYVGICYSYISITIGFLFTSRVVLGIVAIFLVLEANRLTAGWPLVITALLFIGYAAYGHLLPGELSIRFISWPRLINQLYLGADFLFGLPLRVTSSIVLAFILFGRFLDGLGGGDFFFDFAESVIGHQRGGIAKVSLIASSLFGMLTGSAVANVAATGSVTIPLMKKRGYDPSFAAAVEASASTGSQITPPIMGAAVFVMAEFLGISYVVVMMVSILPAILYYFNIFVQIDLESAKQRLRGLPRSQLPSLTAVFKKGWFYLGPIAAFLYALFFLYIQPGRAIIYSTILLIVLSFFLTRLRPKLLKVLDFLELTTQAFVPIVIICSIAGFIVGICNYSGLASKISRLFAVLDLPVLVLLFFTMITSLVLGMGVPPLPKYILLAMLLAPVLVRQGLDPLLVHLFIFQFGIIAHLTPPVCLASYVAASIAESSLTKTALWALKFVWPYFLLPYIFLFNPDLVFRGTGTVWKSFFSMGVTILAVYSLGIAVIGYIFEDKLGWIYRLLFLFTGYLFLFSNFQTALASGGFLIFSSLLFYLWRQQIPEKRVPV